MKGAETVKGVAKMRQGLIGLVIMLGSLVVRAESECGQILHIKSPSQFAEAVNGSDKLCLVDFYADWCGPCRRLSPVIQEVAAGNPGKLTVAKVNVDKLASLSGQYNVSGIPHLLLIKNGRVLATRTGYLGEKALNKWLAKYL